MTTHLDQSDVASKDQQGNKPIPLSPRYLAAVRAMENAQWNRNGADKSWVELQMDEMRDHFARVKRIR